MGSSVRPRFPPSVDTMRWVAYKRSSSYSFLPIFFKLCRCFCHDLEMCMWFWCYPPVMFSINFLTFFDLFFPGQITITIDTLWAQILLEFATDILKLCIRFKHSLKICMLFRVYPPIIFYQHFSTFWTCIFSRSD